MRTGIVLLSLALVSCSVRAQRSPVARRTAAPEMVIGGDSGVQNPIPVVAVRDVKVGRDGRIYVLDAYDLMIKVFNDSGTYLQKFGGKGRGAGVFGNARAIDVTRSSVVVRDGTYQKVVTFGLDGRLQHEQPFPVAEVRAPRYPVRDGGTIIAETPTWRPVGRNDMASPLFRAVSFRRANQSTTDTLFTIRADTVHFHQDGVVDQSVPVVARFGASGAWALDGDSLVAYVDGYTGDVTWYALSGKGARPIRTANMGRGGPLVTADEERDEATRIAAQFMARRRPSDALFLPGQPTLLSAPPRWSVATKAFFAQDGALWIGVNRITYISSSTGDRTYVGEANTWTVFPVTGPVFTVDLRPLFTLTAVRGNKLYGMLYDAHGDLLVTVYRLES